MAGLEVYSKSLMQGPFFSYVVQELMSVAPTKELQMWRGVPIPPPSIHQTLWHHFIHPFSKWNPLIPQLPEALVKIEMSLSPL